MPLSVARARARSIAVSLMSTPWMRAPRRAIESVSAPALHWRCTTRLPLTLPRRSISSGKSVVPPSRRNAACPRLWLSCAVVAAFHDLRFCSCRSLRTRQRLAHHPRDQLRDLLPAAQKDDAEAHEHDEREHDPHASTVRRGG